MPCLCFMGSTNVCKHLSNANDFPINVEYSLLRAEAMEIWPNPLRNSPETWCDPGKIMILDWDDTLFPATFMCSSISSEHIEEFQNYDPEKQSYIKYGKYQLPAYIQAQFAELDSCIIELLQTCVSNCIEPVIITGSVLAWFHYSLSSFLPLTFMFMKLFNIGSMSAREFYLGLRCSFHPQNIENDEGLKWKVHTFNALLDSREQYSNRLIVLCVGDSSNEHEAIQKLVNEKEGHTIIRALSLHVCHRTHNIESLCHHVMKICMSLVSDLAHISNSTDRRKYMYVQMEYPG